MRVKVLGCSGAESPGSNSPAILLDDGILFDAGTLASVLGERQQMKIRTIFVTHAHLDHIRGIPFLADNIVMARKMRRFTVYRIPSVVRTIRKHLFNSAVWPDFTVIPHPDDAILALAEVKEGRPVRGGSTRSPRSGSATRFLPWGTWWRTKKGAGSSTPGTRGRRTGRGRRSGSGRSTA
jgi:ribonuclease BN (tRNA processing enzyme)